MKIAITKLISLDTHRDGGSLSSTFAGQSDTQYTLMLPIKLPGNIGNRAEPKNYSLPILETYKKIPRTSPITGIVNYVTERQDQVISWSEAREIIRTLKTFLHQADPNDVFIYSAMEKISNSDGSIEVSS